MPEQTAQPSPKQGLWSRLSSWQQVIAALVAAIAAVAAVVIPIVWNQNTTQNVPRIAITQLKRVAIEDARLEQWAISGTVRGLHGDDRVYVLTLENGLGHAGKAPVQFDIEGLPGRLQGPADVSITDTKDGALSGTWHSVIKMPRGSGLVVEAIIASHELCIECDAVPGDESILAKSGWRRIS